MVLVGIWCNKKAPAFLPEPFSLCCELQLFCVRILQTSQPAMVGVPDDASKIPTRRFSGERRLAYLTANEVSNPSLESRLNKNRHFVKCNFLDKSYFIENIHYCVTLFNIRFAYSSCLIHSPTRLSKKSL